VYGSVNQETENMENDLKKRVSQIIRILKKEYPDPKTALHYSNPLELTVATILSAQCTDVRVNQVTEDLFKKYKSAGDYAGTELSELEQDIRSTGFYRNKAKSIKNLCTELAETYNGNVPGGLDDLVKLPGIGRKTANLVLGEAFGIPGIVVDTHVLRLSNRIGLTKKTDAVKVEFELMDIVAKKQWTPFSHVLILHGRAVCKARKPDHSACKILKYCDEGAKWAKEK